MADILDSTTINAIADLGVIDPLTGFFIVKDFDAHKTALEDGYRRIVGNDVYLAPDSIDAQQLAIFAKAQYDTNLMLQAIQLMQSPTYATGENLAQLVRINGVVRRGTAKSSVDVRIVGQAGTVIDNGEIQGIDQVKWLLPPLVIIPQSGEITVTALSKDFGAIPAPAGYLNQIATPKNGWQTVSNLLDATLGAPIETDAELRERQRISTIGSGRASLEAISKNLSLVPGVLSLIGYENYTNLVSDGINPPYTPAGLPPHSVTFVIDGGDIQDIVDAYGRTKASGSNPNGNVGALFIGQGGIPREFKFFRPVNVDIAVNINIKSFRGYTNAVSERIKTAVGAYINGLSIGDQQFWINKVRSEAELRTDPFTDTFYVDSVEISRNAGPFLTVDTPLAFYERAIINPLTDIIVTVLP